MKTTHAAIILSAVFILFDLIFSAPRAQAQAASHSGPTATAMRGQAAPTAGLWRWTTVNETVNKK